MLQITQLVTQNTKNVLKVAYKRGSPERMRQQKSNFEQHESYSLHSSRPDGSHSDLSG